MFQLITMDNLVDSPCALTAAEPIWARDLLADHVNPRTLDKPNSMNFAIILKSICRNLLPNRICSNSEVFSWSF